MVSRSAARSGSGARQAKGRYSVGARTDIPTDRAAAARRTSYVTSESAPTATAEAPSAYVRQLALYRAVLQKLYPQLPVRAALLWTETPELMEISAPALDAQLASIIST